MELTGVWFRQGNASLVFGVENSKAGKRLGKYPLGELEMGLLLLWDGRMAERDGGVQPGKEKAPGIP